MYIATFTNSYYLWNINTILHLSVFEETQGVIYFRPYFNFKLSIRKYISFMQEKMVESE